LSDEQLQQLPVLRVPPRKYWSAYYHPAQAERCSLVVSARAAGNLVGLSSTGPEENEDEQWRNIHYGMASIRSPSVSRDGLVEAGVWCKLCGLPYEYAAELEFRPLVELANKNSSAGPVKQPGAALALQVRPMALFEEHARSCHCKSLHSLTPR
jgi:hypothetical protein